MEEYKFKYNYVIIGAGGYYLNGYHDIMSLPNVSYHSSYADGFDSWLSRQVLRWNFSNVVNRHVCTPFSWYVYPRLYPLHFSDNRPLCFLFFGNTQYIYQTSYTEYLRKRYPQARLVLYMQDLVERYPQSMFEKVSPKMDLLLSYDKGDCHKYGMLFHPTPMSYVHIPDNLMLPPSDVYFCGYAKSRFPVVHRIYNELTSQGLTCDFNLLGMPDMAPRIDGIKYISQPFSYTENLQHVVKTKCILEVMQEGADGYTPRLWESIMYNRHLLTNNSTLKDSKYFHPNGMHEYGETGNIDVRPWLDMPISYDEEFKNSLSPVHLLQFIDQAL